jgi:hypothetical protein
VNRSLTQTEAPHVFVLSVRYGDDDHEWDYPIAAFRSLRTAMAEAERCASTTLRWVTAAHDEHDEWNRPVLDMWQSDEWQITELRLLGH